MSWTRMRGLATAVTRACRTGKSAGILLSALAGWLPTQSASADGERMLVFTKTVGYRHDSIPAAIAAIRTLAARHGIEIDHTEDAATFHRDKLSGFKVVGFVNTTGNVLDGEQQRAFEAFVAGGGGYLGVHSAADTEYDWPWYGDLVGAWFKSHPPGLQTGTVRFARPLGGSWPVAWRVTDEFYNFRSRPKGEAALVAALDESTYEGERWAPTTRSLGVRRFTAADPGIPGLAIALNCLLTQSFWPTSKKGCFMRCLDPTTV